jgi:hypothetical protein
LLRAQHGATPLFVAGGCYSARKPTNSGNELVQTRNSLRVDRLEVTRILDFGIEAISFVMDLRDQLYSFVIRLQSDEGEAFAIMSEMGFFKWTGNHYQMVVPSRLTLHTVKDALLRLALTEDAEYVLHPEYFVKAVPLLEAIGWQLWLRERNEEYVNRPAN